MKLNLHLELRIPLLFNSQGTRFQTKKKRIDSVILNFLSMTTNSEAHFPTPCEQSLLLSFSFRGSKSRNPENGIRRPETIRENYNNLLTHCTLCYNPHTQVFNLRKCKQNGSYLALLLSVDIMTSISYPESSGFFASG